jgi:hypothetical protein
VRCYVALDYICFSMTRYTLEDVYAFYACKWKGCTDRSSNTAAGLYQHLLSVHLDPTAASAQCFWHTCDLDFVSYDDLCLHLRTHVPIHAGPRVPQPSSTSKDSTQPPLNALVLHRWDSPTSRAGATDRMYIGLGYLSLAIVRNLARCVAGAMSKATGKRADESADRRRARDEGIFGRLVEAERAAAVRAGEATAVRADGEDDDGKKRGPDARVASGAMLALEREMVLWAERGAGMSKVVGEILSHLDAIGRALEVQGGEQRHETGTTTRGQEGNDAMEE